MFVIELVVDGTNVCKYMHHHADPLHGLPHFTVGMFTATRFFSFDEVRGEYQRMVSAPTVKVPNAVDILPATLRHASGINGSSINEAVVTCSIVEVSGENWPEIRGNRIVSHTLRLIENEAGASVTIE